MSINPDRLTYIVKIAATLFDHTNKTINPNPNKISEMHYVADLLKELVNTAYPRQEESDTEPLITIFDIDVGKLRARDIKDLDKQMENILKTMGNYKPPMAGEF